MTATFSREDARQFYDRFGARQDQQGFYEDAALAALIRHGAFSDAQSILEIGCGTGRLAARLLSEHLPATARYAGIDLSQVMVGLAKNRLKPWDERAEVHLGNGDFEYASYGGPFDRIVSTYVFDLLGDAEIAEALAAMHAVVKKGGLLCTAGLTNGTGLLSAVTSTLWTMVHGLNPSIVGGCRPLDLSKLLPETQWRIVHREIVVSVTVPSEILVAEAI